MEYDNLPQSSNIEDRRGQRGGAVGAGGLGIGAIIVIFAISYFTGISPQVLIGGAEMIGVGQNSAPPPSSAPPDPNDPMRVFLSKVVGSTEQVWAEVLPAQEGVKYQPAPLVIYDGATRSGCGGAQSAMGPFYCPLDRKLYLDTSFFQDMQRRLGGGGDFAYAYVISHEVGHHVQNLLGILPKVQQAQDNAPDKATANAISVRVELMADCFAGVWANKMNQRHNNIDENDVRAAVNTASAIGDDRLERRSRGVVVPDSFTHGSSDQRVRWLLTGLKTGSVKACDTFQSSSL